MASPEEAGSQFLLEQRTAAHDRSGIPAEQDGELVFGLLALQFQAGERGAGAFHEHFGLAEIDLGGIAVIHAKLNQIERILAELESAPGDFAVPDPGRCKRK